MKTHRIITDSQGLTHLQARRPIFLFLTRWIDIAIGHDRAALTHACTQLQAP